jgi:hypothetical protein
MCLQTHVRVLLLLSGAAAFDHYARSSRQHVLGRWLLLLLLLVVPRWLLTATTAAACMHMFLLPQHLLLPHVSALCAATHLR